MIEVRFGARESPAHQRPRMKILSVRIEILVDKSLLGNCLVSLSAAARSSQPNRRSQMRNLSMREIKTPASRLKAQSRNILAVRVGPIPNPEGESRISLTRLRNKRVEVIIEPTKRKFGKVEQW